MYFLIVILCAFLVFAIYMAVKSYKQNVERENNYIRVKMSRLGSITGYTYNQIVNIIGAPNARQAINGGMSCTWCEYERNRWDNSIVGVYTVSLIFDSSEICVGISNESYV